MYIFIQSGDLARLSLMITAGHFACFTYPAPGTIAMLDPIHLLQFRLTALDTPLPGLVDTLTIIRVNRRPQLRQARPITDQRLTE